MTNVLPKLVVVLLLCSSFAHAIDWDPVSEEDLQSMECRSDPSAGAEILYKRLTVDMGIDQNRYREIRIRMKLYKESAVETFRSFKIRYGQHWRISNLHARVVKPHGEVFELDKNDIYSQVELKTRRGQMRSTSFSLPNVEVGDIIEYRYRLLIDSDGVQGGLFVTFQEQWPIRKLDLKIRPYTGRRSGFKWISSKVDKPLKKNGNGFYVLNLENLSAYPDEEYQFPDRDVKSWFLFFVVNSSKTGDSYWKSMARKLYREVELYAKPDADIKTKAREITKGISGKKERLEALYDFSRSELINSTHSKPEALTQDQRKKLHYDMTASRVLKQGYGTRYNMNILFCALARASGFDARIAAVADRSKTVFSKNLENIKLALPYRLVAVKLDGEWSFYNVAARYEDFGMPKWENDGVTALVGDKQNLIFAKTNTTGAEHSRILKIGTFELDTSGTLKGTVKIEVTGNYGVEMKRSLDGMSLKQQRDFIRKQIKETWPNAEADAIEPENMDDPFKIASIRYQVTIPQYAEVVGKRIYIQPSVFRKNEQVEFASSERATDLFFNFKYSHEDKVEIKLPDGYTLDKASADVPKGFEVEGLIAYQTQIEFGSNTLHYSRSLAFHGRKLRKKAYPILKKVFNGLHGRDQHLLMLNAAEADAQTEATFSDKS